VAGFATNQGSPFFPIKLFPSWLTLPEMVDALGAVDLPLPPL
jgi:hypothetical protein